MQACDGDRTGYNAGMRASFQKRYALLICLLLLSAFLAACSATPPTPLFIPDTPTLQTLTPTSSPSSATASPLPPQPSFTPEPVFDLRSLQNQDYTLPDFRAMLTETGGVILLRDGVFDHPIPDSAATLHAQLIDGALGDLDADGDPDAAAVLAVESGGSGMFYYLVALESQGGALRQAAITSLGDRIKLNSILIQEGGIRLQELVHAATDPQCCPSQEKAADYRLVAGQLSPPEYAGAVLQAQAAIQALKDQDMPALAALAHPAQGVRFSPYSYVRPEDLVFTPESIATLMEDPTVYTWGAFDGSGLPIEMAFPEYDQRFVYSSDFANPDSVSINQRIGSSNTIDNSQEFYPGAVVVEYYRAPQDPQYGGMDWQSLRLVFQPEGDRWYLVGVIHDEWTI